MNFDVSPYTQITFSSIVGQVDTFREGYSYRLVKSTPNPGLRCVRSDVHSAVYTVFLRLVPCP